MKTKNIFSKQSGIKFVIIRGLSGSGKTTLSRMFLRNNTEGLSIEINSETRENIFQSFLKLAIVLSEIENLKIGV